MVAGHLDWLDVDKELWGFIKWTFPQQVESAQAGMDEIDPEEVFPCVAVHQFADPGDIKSQFKYSLDQSNRCNMYMMCCVPYSTSCSLML